MLKTTQIKQDPLKSITIRKWNSRLKTLKTFLYWSILLESLKTYEAAKHDKGCLNYELGFHLTCQHVHVCYMLWSVVSTFKIEHTS